MQLPEFKYNPNAYLLDIIIKKTIVCECCCEQRDYKYEGPFYSKEEIENICPWCIKNGKAAEKFDGEFQDSAGVEEVDNEEAVDEVSFRTPGYLGIQQEVWLGHCDDLCAFIGYAKPKLVKPILGELQEDIENSGFEVDEIIDGLKEQEVEGYVFKCLHCGKHRISLD